jgi:hypothetical protein
MALFGKPSTPLPHFFLKKISTSKPSIIFFPTFYITSIIFLFFLLLFEQKAHYKTSCLTNHSQLSIFFFSLLPKKLNKKILTFLHFFISHQLYFITIQIKKTHYKTKLFHFSIKHSQILYHINHLLLYNTQIFYNIITYQTYP